MNGRLRDAWILPHQRGRVNFDFLTGFTPLVLMPNFIANGILRNDIIRTQGAGIILAGGASWTR